jgi:ferredoxin
MRLKPRSLKRWMFSCTQCGLCIDACATVNTAQAAAPLLRWTSGDAALRNEAAFSAVDAMTPLSRKLPQKLNHTPDKPHRDPMTGILARLPVRAALPCCSAAPPWLPLPTSAWAASGSRWPVSNAANCARPWSPAAGCARRNGSRWPARSPAG